MLYKNMKQEFAISFLFFLILGAVLSYNSYDDNFLRSLLFGYLGALSVFFVPYLFKKQKKDK